MNSKINTNSIRESILDQGFDLCGFTDPQLGLQEQNRFKTWLESGYAAEMSWLRESANVRLDPRSRFEWANTAVCLAVAYGHRQPEREMSGISGRISSYARGRSYHNVIRKRLRRVCAVLAEAGGENNVGYCDTGPVHERALAAQAGLGWRGRNSLLLNSRVGSKIFLAVVLTSLRLDRDGPTTDHCGSCTACVEACPTDALVADGVLDSRRCISYLNIEHRSQFDPPYDAGWSGWLHGCDICQDVCPFVIAASREQRYGDPDFLPRESWSSVTLEDLVDISEHRWSELTMGSDVRRGGPGRLRRNAVILLDQIKDSSKPDSLVE